MSIRSDYSENDFIRSLAETASGSISYLRDLPGKLVLKAEEISDGNQDGFIQNGAIPFSSTFSYAGFSKLFGSNTFVDSSSDHSSRNYFLPLLLLGGVGLGLRFGIPYILSLAKNEALRGFIPKLATSLGFGGLLIGCSSKKVAPIGFRQGPNVNYLNIESYRNPQIQNWSKIVQFKPEIIFYPKNQNEIIRIVQDANEKDKAVSIIGKGHSWNSLMEGPNYLISTVDLNKIIKIDEQNNLVTVEAGATIAQVDAELAKHNLNVPCNIVGTTDITFGGLMATGSHGSGRRCAPMSDLMVEVEMVKPDGTVETFSDATHGKDKMDALRLNLGLFGVMHKITFKVEKAFNVEVTDQEVPIRDVFKVLPELLRTKESVEVLWFPLTEKATIKSWVRSNKSLEDISWDESYENRKASTKREAALYYFEKRIAPLLDNPLTAPEALQLIREHSPKVFPPRTYLNDVNSAIHYVNEAMKFPINETEIAIPFDGPDDLVNVQKGWNAMINTTYANEKKGNYTPNIIAHMRFTRGSTAYMSPAYGNKMTAWMDFGSYYTTPGWKDLVNTIGPIWRSIPGAKLHWAKGMTEHNGFDFEALKKMYGGENVEKFLKFREEMDPNKRFSRGPTAKLFGL